MSGNQMMKETLNRYSNRLKDFFSTTEIRKRFIRAGVVILVLFLLLPKVIPLFYDAVEFFEEEEEDVNIVDVIVLESTRHEDKISATGTMRANQEVELSSEVSGIITDLLINEGSEVEQGELLVKINDNDLQAERRGIEYQLEVMESAEERQRQLVEEGGATQEDYDNTLIELSDLEAAHENIEAQIERTEVRAPFDGILGLKYVNQGSYITPDTDIATLQDLSSVYIDFSVPERYAPQVQSGNEVIFELQGVDSTLIGEVYASEPRVDPHSRTLQVRAVSDNPDGILRPGAFARIELVLESFDDAIMLPSIALMPENGAYKVYTYENGTVEEVYVSTGARTEDQVQVLDGLHEQDTVLVNGLLQVSEGSSVSIGEVQTPDENL